MMDSIYLIICEEHIIGWSDSSSVKYIAAVDITKTNQDILDILVSKDDQLTISHIDDLLSKGECYTEHSLTNSRNTKIIMYYLKKIEMNTLVSKDK